MSLATIFSVLITFVSLLLILIIMVQNPKGGGLSSAFGSGPQVAGGVKDTGNFLDRGTWTLIAVLLCLILFSNALIKRNIAGASAPDLKTETIETQTLPETGADQSSSKESDSSQEANTQETPKDTLPK